MLTPEIVMSPSPELDKVNVLDTEFARTVDDSKAIIARDIKLKRGLSMLGRQVKGFRYRADKCSPKVTKPGTLFRSPRFWAYSSSQV
jgi:hypothetical protein